MCHLEKVLQNGKAFKFQKQKQTQSYFEIKWSLQLLNTEKATDIASGFLLLHINEPREPVKDHREQIAIVFNF